MIKLNLSSTIVLDKKFKGARNGYDPLDVDIFFDKVLHDYHTIEANEVVSKTEISELKNKVSNCENRITQLEIENASLKSRLSNIKEGDAVTKDNVALIKRINLLEKFIFEKGFDPSKIK